MNIEEIDTDFEIDTDKIAIDETEIYVRKRNYVTKETDVSFGPKTTVSDWHRREIYPPRRKQTNRRKGMSETTKNRAIEITKLYEAGLKTKQIAEKLGKSVRAIRATVINYDLYLRSKGVTNGVN